MVEKREKEKSRVKWLVLLLFLLLLLLGLAIMIILLQRKCNRNITEPAVSTEDLEDGVGLIIDSDAENSRSPENLNNEKQDVAISGWGSISIPVNQKEIAVNFYNPEENADLFYLTFELRLFNENEKNYEVLYTSGLVEPGKYINQITLSHGLEKGVYDAVVHVQPYRMNETKTRTNNADMKIKLIVK